METVNRSPLGKYAQVVAAAMAVTLIVAFVFALLFRRVLGIEEADLQGLKEFALIAAGAVFASAAAINGVKEPIEAAHNRIDHIETATGIATHGAYPSTPPAAPWTGEGAIRGGDAHDSDPADPPEDSGSPLPRTPSPPS